MRRSGTVVVVIITALLGWGSVARAASFTLDQNGSTLELRDNTNAVVQTSPAASGITVSQPGDTVTVNAISPGGTVTVGAAVIDVEGTVNSTAAIALTATAALTINASITATGATLQGDSVVFGATVDTGTGNTSVTATGTTITGTSPNDGVAEVRGHTVSLVASGTSNGNTGQIGFFTASAQFFEVDADILNATTNNSRMWISEVGSGATAGAQIGSVNAGTNTAFLRTINGGAWSSATVDGTADVTAAAVDVRTSGGNIGVSAAAPLEIDASTLRTAVGTAAGNIFIRDTAGGVNATLATTFSGNISLETVGGAMQVSGVQAPGSSVTLKSSSTIDGTTGGGADVTASTLILTSSSGIGGTTPVETAVSSLDYLNSTSGPVDVTNTGALTITGHAIGVGATTISASSPLTVSIGMSSVGTISLSAIETASEGDDLTVNPGVNIESGSGDIDLAAGDSVVLKPGSNVQSDAGAIAISIGAGDLDGIGGGTLQGTLDAFSTLTVTGGAANDQLAVDFGSGALLLTPLTYDGGAGSNSLSVLDAGSNISHTDTVGATSVLHDLAAINFTNIASLSLTGGNASDTFLVTPSAAFTVAVTGGTPVPPTLPGDSLTVDETGTTTPVLTASHDGSGFHGSYTFGNRDAVTFQTIETLDPAPAAAPIPPGVPTVSLAVATLLALLLGFLGLSMLARRG